MRLWRPIALATALQAAARAGIGDKLLARRLKRTAGLPCEERRRDACALFERRSWLFSANADFNNRFDVPWRQVAFHRLNRNLLRDPGYTPPVVRGDPVPLDGGPLFVATLHCRMGQALLRYLHQSTGRDIALIVSKGNAATHGAREAMYGDAPVELIVSDETCFLRARKAFREGRIVVSCVDYTEREHGWLSHEIWIAAALFELPIRSRARMAYAVTGPRADGEVHIDFEMARERAGGAEYAGDFVAFVDRHWPRREPRHIAPPGRRQSHHPLKSGLWVPSRSRIRA